MERKYKTRYILGTTTKGNFEKIYGEVRTFERISPKKFKITYFPKNTKKLKNRLL